VTARDRPDRTELSDVEILVRGANCSWCFGEAIDDLRQLDGVLEVHGSIRDERITVRNVEVPTSVMVDSLREHLHGTDSSSHECQMVAVEPETVRQTVGSAHPSLNRMARVGAAEPMETLVEAIVRLRIAGYTTDLFASPEGDLVCRACGSSHDPEAIEIRETVRFEGDSNPDDEAILVAVSSIDGCLGQFTAAFGPGTATADAMALRRLTLSGAARPSSLGRHASSDME
jgi:hypothetical protein